MIKAVVFDLWITLIPATVNFPHLFSLLKEQDISPPEFTGRYERAVQLKKYASFEELKEDFFKAFSQSDNKLLEDELTEIFVNRIQKIDFYPDVRKVLIELRKKGYKLALLSNTENLIGASLEKKINLSSYFDVFGVSYEIGALKPDKKAFKFVLKKLKVKPSEALMIGDSLRNDIIGAQRVGMHNCLINRLGKVIDSAKATPEFEIKSLSEVNKVLGVLNAKKN